MWRWAVASSTILSNKKRVGKKPTLLSQSRNRGIRRETTALYLDATIMIVNRLFGFFQHLYHVEYQGWEVMWWDAGDAILAVINLDA